ncbi:MAG: 2-amino-4-hydroxy-6-hydroxymethyldihydropteridine diphosphokinase [Vicinamibacterales bacterium]
MKKRAVIAVGSNLGDRRAAMAFAAEHLAAILSNLTLSDVVETEPEGEAVEGDPLFLNAVMVGETALSARALLEELMSIERAFGRERRYAGAPRTLDLDLIMLGEDMVDEPDLQVPHPRFRERFFVLGPLAQIAPDVRDPVTGLRVGELLRNLLRDERR